MERELVGLLGAGLTSLATGYGITVPVGAIDRGYTLVDVLSRESGPRIGAALNGMVQTLWLDWQQTGLARETLAQHAGALPAIIELNRPRPDAFGAARDRPDGGQLLAAVLVEQSRHSGDIARAGLDEGIVYALVERLYQAILAQAAVLPEMMAAVDLYLQTNLWRQDQSQPPAADPPREVAPAATPPRPPAIEPILVPRLAKAAIVAIRQSVEAHGKAIADPERMITDLSQAMTAVIERVTELAQRTPEISQPLIEAARKLAVGDFNGADRDLASAEQTVIHRATANLSSARQMMLCASEVLTIRASLDEARLDFRKAARQFRTATRCLPSSDGATIWKLLIRQAQALLRQDKLKQDDAAFTEASRAVAEACALDIRQVGDAAWAGGQMQLVQLLLELGTRTGDVTALLDCARHAQTAHAAFMDLQAWQAAAEALLARGEALWLAGDRTGDAGILEGAAQSLRTSLDTYTRDVAPDRWVDISSKLGQVLLRMSAVRGEPKLLPSAIEHLRGAVQFAATCNVAIDTLASETALGRALLGEYAAGGQPLLLDLAATAFRRAIKSAAANRNTEGRAALQHELGMTLWAMSDRSGNANDIAAAIEALDASIDGFESIGASARAAAVRTDRDALSSSLPAQSITGRSTSGIQYS